MLSLLLLGVASLGAGAAEQTSLAGTPLQSCSQANDKTTTGWTRSGSCVWTPSDGGYHEVCVTMSTDFLKTSTIHDRNDLSSVVSHGGHWCICAWAFASAVSRDPTKLEGIELDCERTNSHLRQVYQTFIDSHRDLTSPSGAAYNAQAALNAVERLCPAAPTLARAAAQRVRSDGLSAPSAHDRSDGGRTGFTLSFVVPAVVLALVVAAVALRTRSRTAADSYGNF
ncbi:hypothetical protein T492DRAFT_919707 [Pavlovales sp. CCMP2436]|nr:hypothetical protein T492DRAFT_919707 [Pavlovales sp. CCMP2436]|mmetsp:Transcript_138/g.366  ORF Transcript_138/g.366 Transcript_138/m.366 type:complete len:226 (-) Transcript_138:181-858(-)